MSDGIVIRGRRIGTPALLMALFGVALIAALLTPETVTRRGGLSSRSYAPDGAAITFELARRMGWPVLRRDAPLDSAPVVATQVVIDPSDALGAHEVHRLLENVRRGGGLLFTVENREIADSLGLALRSRGELLVGTRSDCPRRERFGQRAAASLPPTVHDIVWRRPAPGPVTQFASGSARRSAPSAAIAFPLRDGRVVAVSTGEVFTNDAMRTCEWGADLLVARAFELLRPSGGSQALVFDEFHHGSGRHPGSVGAMAGFLSGTGAGRFFATLLVAGFVLLLAAAPRPVVPRDPPAVARRSPLEHADALGRAYADVGATRTAVARLLSGVRRRAGRVVAAPRNADDGAFLGAAVLRAPAIATQAALVRRALTEPVPPRDLIAVGVALNDIERDLLTTSSTTT